MTVNLQATRLLGCQHRSGNSHYLAGCLNLSIGDKSRRCHASFSVWRRDDVCCVQCHSRNASLLCLYSCLRLGCLSPSVCLPVRQSVCLPARARVCLFLWPCQGDEELLLLPAVNSYLRAVQYQVLEALQGQAGGASFHVQVGGAKTRTAALGGIADVLQMFRLRGIADV
jgi:hypothetical protein